MSSLVMGTAMLDGNHSHAAQDIYSGLWTPEKRLVVHAFVLCLLELYIGSLHCSFTMELCTCTSCQLFSSKLWVISTVAYAKDPPATVCLFKIDAEIRSAYLTCVCGIANWKTSESWKASSMGTECFFQREMAFCKYISLRKTVQIFHNFN